MEIKLNDKTFTVKAAVVDDLQTLYDNSSLTIIGLTEDSIKDWMEALLEDIVDATEIIVYTITGEMMNNHYGLTGKNAYPDDLTIVSFESNQCFGNKLGKVAIDRFSYGGRWFDDIVDNNARNEE